MEVVSINLIKPNDSNPRIIKDDKFKKLVQSIKDFPEMLDIRPIVVNKEMIVLGGNMRLKACKEAGLKQVPIIVTDLTEEQQKEFIIKDNVSGGEWDWDMLANEWDVTLLNDWGLDLPDILEALTPEEGEDDIPEVQAISVIGDIYELNNHRVNCGNSCSVDDIDKLMNGKKADLIFTDPPYDLEDNYSNIVIDQAKEDCHVFIMNSDKLLIKNIQNNEAHFRKMFYVDFRQARLVSNNQPMTRVDPIAEFLKGKGKFNNLRDGFSTLIQCAKIHNNNEAQNHGFNQAKKVELPENFILHYTKPNELVADFFGGSGSTLIASEKNNRVAYINEFEPKHVDIIVKRWINYMKEHDKLFELKRNGEIISEEIFA